MDVFDVANEATERCFFGKPLLGAVGMSYKAFSLARRASSSFFLLLPVTLDMRPRNPLALFVDVAIVDGGAVEGGGGGAVLKKSASSWASDRIFGALPPFSASIPRRDRVSRGCRGNIGAISRFTEKGSRESGSWSVGPRCLSPPVGDSAVPLSLSWLMN